MGIDNSWMNGHFSLTDECGFFMWLHLMNTRGRYCSMCWTENSLKKFEYKIAFFVISFIVFVVFSCSSTENDRIHIRIMLGEGFLMSLRLWHTLLGSLHPTSCGAVAATAYSLRSFAFATGKGQLLGSMFMIFIHPDLLHPLWRQWSMTPSPSYTYTEVLLWIIETSCYKVPVALTLHLPSLCCCRCTCLCVRKLIQSPFFSHSTF